MLPALVIRQSFVVADIVLGALVFFAAIMVGLAVVSDEPTAAVATAPAAATGVEEISFAAVSDRHLYDRIIENKLFGASADASRDAPPPEPVKPPEPVEADTKLPLQLLGTVGWTGVNRLVSAVIEVRDGPVSVGTFYIGQEVVDRVTLLEVHPKEVLLDNQRTNQIEYLRMLEGEERYKVPERRPGRRRAARPNRSSKNQTINISRNEIARDLVQNFDEIANQINIEEYKDKNGKVIGLTASNLDSVPLAKKLGIQDGDVLTSINNEPIDSVDKVFEIVEKSRNQSTFRISILRDGKPKQIYYRLR